ncbi:MAG: hypothetical protein V7776_11395 [Halopseudomonas aestusnigri]
MGSILKHIIWEFVFEGLWRLLCFLIKGWGALWISFYSLFLSHKPKLAQTLGVISALAINPITLCFLVGYWPEVVLLAQSIGEGTFSQ